MPHRSLILTTLELLLLGSCALPPPEPERPMHRDHDKQEILAHIHGIFEAYVGRDREAIRRAHTQDWTGFQGPSTAIERGIDAYMMNAERSLDALRGTGFDILDTEVQLLGDAALVYYVARYDYEDGEGQAGSIPLRALDVYRRTPAGWNQSGSHITVIPEPSESGWGEGSDQR